MDLSGFLTGAYHLIQFSSAKVILARQTIIVFHLPLFHFMAVMMTLMVTWKYIIILSIQNKILSYTIKLYYVKRTVCDCSKCLKASCCWTYNNLIFHRYCSQAIWQNSFVSKNNTNLTIAGYTTEWIINL